MGLFDKLSGSKPLTPKGGLLLAAITMIAADGEVDDNEFAVIHRLDGEKVTPDWEAAQRAWRSRSVGECVSLAAAALNRDQRVATIANLIDIAMADGVLDGAEEKLLEVYVDAFGLDADVVSRIVDVIAIKNNKDVFR